MLSALTSEDTLWTPSESLPTSLKKKVVKSTKKTGTPKFKNLKVTKKGLYCGEIGFTNDELVPSKYIKFYISEHTIRVSKTKSDDNLIDIICTDEVEDDIETGVIVRNVEQHINWEVVYLEMTLEEVNLWLAFNYEVKPKSKNVTKLFISCENNKPDIRIDLPFHVSYKKKRVPISYRFDDEDFVEEDWQPAFQGNIKRNESLKKNVKFLKKFLDSNSLTVTTEDSKGKKIQADFNLQGFDKVADKILNDCPGKEKYWE